MKKMLEEFKKFIVRGSVIDLAVGVIMGSAFGKITTSLVGDIIMPFISIITGGVNFTDWKWVITEASYDAQGVLLTAETAIKYGNFIQVILDFFIIAIVIFALVKIINVLRESSEEKILRLEKLTFKRKSKTEKVAEKIESMKEKVKAEEEAKAEEETKAKEQVEVLSKEEVLLMEIRDLLKEKK